MRPFDGGIFRNKLTAIEQITLLIHYSKACITLWLKI